MGSTRVRKRTVRPRLSRSLAVKLTGLVYLVKNMTRNWQRQPRKGEWRWLNAKLLLKLPKLKLRGLKPPKPIP